MREYNVCLINDSFPPEIDGVANAVTNYARIINQGYGRATVVTPDHPQADDSVFPFPVLRYPSIDMTKYVGYRAGMPFSPEIQKKLEGGGFELIHSHCPITSTLLARALRYKLDVPVVFTYHTKFDIDIANAINSKLMQEEAKKLLVGNIAACDEVWTVSRGAGENLRKLGYEGGYIVMPNGVDLQRGRVSDELVRSVTADYDLPAGVPMFLFVGRIMWYKGLRIILDALKMLKDSGQDFRMVFVGAGTDKDAVVACRDQLGLGDKVFFSPPIHDREQIRAWYCRADMFLFPSTFDTNGLVVREAAACALGSVLIEGSCAAEDVTDGQNGCLINENASSMFNLLAKLCKNMETVKAIGANAQRDLYMSWDQSVANACQRYGAVIDNFKRGLYHESGGLSEELCRAAAQAMDAINRSRDKQKIRRDELKTGYDELKDGLKANYSGLLGLKDELKGGIQEGQERIRDKLEDLSQRLDRFL